MRLLRLKPALDAFVRDFPHAQRLARDPVEVPHRFTHPRDVETVALLSACIAYGRVDLFKPKLEVLVSRLGPRPARTLTALDAPAAADVTRDLGYRFNLPADFAVLLLGMGKVLREAGSLEAAFLEAVGDGPLHAGLSRFNARLRDVDLRAVHRFAGNTRGLDHLLPAPLGQGAAKRLQLFLRWMVRGPDAVDFGLWRRFSPSRLIVPLDTHLHRIATHLGLTRRADLSWRTAEEITRALRILDPEDPVKYDFALCHYGMSGACPRIPARSSCAQCELLGACHTGRALTRRSAARRR